MDTQTDLRMDPRTDSKSRLLLRILRNPFVSLLVLFNFVFYVMWSGNLFVKMFGSLPGQFLILTSGPLDLLFTGVFFVGNLLLAYWSYGHFVERRPVSELSLPGMGRELGIGLLLGFGLITACFLIAMVLGFYRIEGIDSWQNLVAGLTPGVVTTPLGEELLYRGVVFRILEGVFGGWVALVLSSVWFGVMHSGNEGETFAGLAAIAIVFGPMLAAPYMLTRRLWVGIGLHAAWNYTMSQVYSGSVSGTGEAKGLFKNTFQGPELFTGGSAGMEGSLIAILVSLTFTVVVLILAVRRGKIVPPSWTRKH